KSRSMRARPRRPLCVIADMASVPDAGLAPISAGSLWHGVPGRSISRGAPIALPHPPAMLDGVALEEAERTYDVPLDCLSRRNDPAGTVRDRPGALAGGAEPAVVGIDRRHQRRRFRHGLVRGTRRARALSRGPPGVVRRESALSVPPHPLASLFRSCARRDRHADHAPELSSLRLRPLAVHA